MAGSPGIAPGLVGSGPRRCGAEAVDETTPSGRGAAETDGVALEVGTAGGGGASTLAAATVTVTAGSAVVAAGLGGVSWARSIELLAAAS